MAAAAETARLPVFLRAVTIVECAVVGWAAVLLFALPALGRAQWAWTTPDFNSRFMGAVYFGALVPLVIMALNGRWALGRVVLWMILAFTTEVMVVMFFYTDQFHWDRVDTYGFWALYLLLPVNSAAFLYVFRALPRVDGVRKNRRWQTVLTLSSAILVGYGLALLIAPRNTTSFWPWPVDPFLGRIYAAMFLALALGSWLVRGHAQAVVDATVGVTLLTFGIFTIAGLLLSDATVSTAKKVNFDVAGTWGFLAIGFAMVALGAALAMRLLLHDHAEG